MPCLIPCGYCGLPPSIHAVDCEAPLDLTEDSQPEEKEDTPLVILPKRKWQEDEQDGDSLARDQSVVSAVDRLADLVDSLAAALDALVEALED